MLRTMMKSKIHRATVTASDLNYMGSITVDRYLLEQANILENEKVQVLNLSNGARFETYAIAAEEKSGVICVNGAASRLVAVGDLIIIISYALMAEEEIKNYQPTVLFVNEKNELMEVTKGR